MWREIHEQPRALSDTLAPYIVGERLAQSFIDQVRGWLGSSQRVLVLASGSSRHAGLLGRTAIQAFASLPTHVDYASEYDEESARAFPDAAVIVISQSGETADTLSALRMANAAGQSTLVVTNVPQSTMAGSGKVSIPTLAGVEQAIPATKSFITQVAVLHLIALALAAIRGTVSDRELREHVQALQKIPNVLHAQLSQDTQLIERSATCFLRASPVVYLGRAQEYALACEGALKLKESAYIHAEAMPAGEFRHGPIAMLGEAGSLVVLCAHDAKDPASVRRHAPTLQLLDELKRKNIDVLALTTVTEGAASMPSTRCIAVPNVGERLLPFVLIPPLQLLAYYAAIHNNVDVDRPRNLVKAVT